MVGLDNQTVHICVSAGVQARLIGSDVSHDWLGHQIRNVMAMAIRRVVALSRRQTACQIASTPMDQLEHLLKNVLYNTL